MQNSREILLKHNKWATVALCTLAGAEVGQVAHPGSEYTQLDGHFALGAS
jgi:hypothetical protein